MYLIGTDRKLGRYKGSRQKLLAILQTQNWENGSLRGRTDKFEYFQCWMYVADAK
jgi:hypothetical protein